MRQPKRALWAEQQATRQAELPAARAKLDRLNRVARPGAS
jgi:hypothetical protein